MNSLIPVIALVLALISSFAGKSEVDAPKPLAMPFVGALFAALLMAGLAFAWPLPDALPAWMPASCLLLTVVAGWVSSARAIPAVAVALGVAVGSFAASIEPRLLPFVAASGLLVSFAAPSRYSTTTVLVAVATSAAMVLGSMRLEHGSAGQIGAIIALGGATGTAFASRLGATYLRALSGAAGALIAAAVVGLHVLQDPVVPIVVGLGLISGFVVRAILGESRRSDAIPAVIAALIWIAVATVAFSLHRGFGMSLAVIGAVAVLLPEASPRALLSVGTLAALVLYRVLHEQLPANRAFDIGQHYALLGLLLGVALPLAFVEYRERFACIRGALQSVLAAILGFGLMTMLALVFGALGIVGLLVGVGLAAFVTSLRVPADETVLAMGLGLGGAAMLSAGWLSKVDELTRDEKVRALLIGGAIAACCVLGWWLISRPVHEDEALDVIA